AGIRRGYDSKSLAKPALPARPFTSVRPAPAAPRVGAFFVFIASLYLCPTAPGANSAPGASDDASLGSHRASVRPLKLSRPPTTEELMAAGQLGGILYPTHELQDSNRDRAARWDFALAIEKWNRHEYPEAVELFKQHTKKWPDSPWAAEATLHVG